MINANITDLIPITFHKSRHNEFPKGKSCMWYEYYNIDIGKINSYDGYIPLTLWAYTREVPGTTKLTIYYQDSNKSVMTENGNLHVPRIYAFNNTSIPDRWKTLGTIYVPTFASKSTLPMFLYTDKKYTPYPLIDDKGVSFSLRFGTTDSTLSKFYQHKYTFNLINAIPSDKIRSTCCGGNYAPMYESLCAKEPDLVYQSDRCNAVVKGYCQKENLDDPQCSCYRYPDYNGFCWTNSCNEKSAYKSQDIELKRKQCATNAFCQQYSKMDSGTKKSLENEAAKYNCSASIGYHHSTVTNDIPEENTTIKDSPADTKSNANIAILMKMHVIMILLILITIIALGINTVNMRAKQSIYE